MRRAHLRLGTDRALVTFEERRQDDGTRSQDHHGQHDGTHAARR